MYLSTFEGTQITNEWINHNTLLLDWFGCFTSTSGLMYNIHAGKDSFFHRLVY